MCRTFLGCKELLQSTAWELAVGQTASDYAECSGYDCLRRTLRSSSHAGGHWFESSSFHQIPPHLRWDFSFAWTPQTVVTARFSSLHANNFDTTLQQVGTNFFASIDFLKGRVAFDLEWNSKDQTFDRDLLAMRTYYDCDIVSVGVIITRAQELNDVFKTIYDYDTKSGTWKPILRKYGASTTWMGKLTSRLDSRRSWVHKEIYRDYQNQERIKRFEARKR